MFSNKTNGIDYGALGANENLFCVKGHTVGTVFIVDEGGDLHAINATVTAFPDAYEDAHLVRAMTHNQVSLGMPGMIRSKWDEFVKYNRKDLVEAGVLGEDSDDALVNVTQLQRLQNGAIWQAYVERQEIKTEVEDLRDRLQVAEKKLILLAA